MEGSIYLGLHFQRGGSPIMVGNRSSKYGDWSRKLISHLHLQAGSKVYLMCEETKHSNPTCSTILPPARLYQLNLPKQLQQILRDVLIQTTMSCCKGIR